MAFRQLNLTLNGNSQVLTGALSDYNDPPIRQLGLQADSANAGVVLFGDSALDATNFAGKIPIPASSVPYGHAVMDVPEGAKVRLSEIYVRGTNTEKVKGWVIF